jgi:hypothetical protein
MISLMCLCDMTIFTSVSAAGSAADNYRNCFRLSGDVVFVIDDSASISPQNYEILKRFATVGVRGFLDAPVSQKLY